MTEQAEVLSAGDARARVAVLEAELAELRKRVCVPEGYVVVPAVTARCSNCDDTGDVHRADGEWLGSCACGAALAERKAFEMWRRVPVGVFWNTCVSEYDGMGIYAGLAESYQAQWLAWKARSSLSAHFETRAPAPVERVEQEQADRTDAIRAAIDVAFELGGQDDGSYRLQRDQLAEAMCVAAYYTPQPAPTAAQDVAGLVSEAAFLLDRLSDIEQCLVDDELCREYQGHVVPSAERLRMLLDAHQSGGAK